MRTTLRKLAGLTPSDWWALNVAYLYLLWAWWQLFFRRDKLNRWVLKGPKPWLQKPLESTERDALARRARWINTASRYPLPWARCLQRSLALCLWLDRQDIDPELKIGVRKDGIALAAHAWVEYGGEVINDSPHVPVKFIAMTGASRLPTIERSEGDTV